MHDDALFSVSVAYDDVDEDGDKYRGRKRFFTVAESFGAAVDKIRSKLPSLGLANPAVMAVDIVGDYIP